MVTVLENYAISLVWDSSFQLYTVSLLFVKHILINVLNMLREILRLANDIMQKDRKGTSF